MHFILEYNSFSLVIISVNIDSLTLQLSNKKTASQKSSYLYKGNYRRKLSLFSITSILFSLLGDRFLIRIASKHMLLPIPMRDVNSTAVKELILILVIEINKARFFFVCL